MLAQMKLGLSRIIHPPGPPRPRLNGVPSSRDGRALSREAWPDAGLVQRAKAAPSRVRGRAQHVFVVARAQPLQPSTDLA